MYGASAQLVITMKGGSVNGFTMVSFDHRNWLTADSTDSWSNRTTLSANSS